MNSDKLVTSEDVLQAVMRLRRTPRDVVLKEIEQREPDLAEYLLEESTMIHRTQIDKGFPQKIHRRLALRIDDLCLVMILSLQSAYKRLWIDLPYPNHSSKPPTANPGDERSCGDETRPTDDV